MVCQSVSCKLKLMKLLSKYVNQNSSKQYYNSYVLPVFDFGCVVWGNTTNANLTIPVKLQKRAARMILKEDFMITSDQFFKELNLLPFPKRVQYHTCLTVYKSITGQAPEYIFSLLTYASDYHERQIRSKTLDLLHIPRSHSANFDRAFSVQGPKLWNGLPADIRNSNSINRFKSELKRYLLYNNWNAWKLCRIRICSLATVGCWGRGSVWSKAIDFGSPCLALHGDTSGFTSKITYSCHLLQRYRLEVS